MAKQPKKPVPRQPPAYDQPKGDSGAAGRKYPNLAQKGSVQGKVPNLGKKK